MIGETPPLHPIRREYDSQGRLERILHGPDPTGGVEALETRITTFEYKDTSDAQNGLLDKVIDPSSPTMMPVE